jgi:hypothetical protein
VSRSFPQLCNPEEGRGKRYPEIGLEILLRLACLQSLEGAIGGQHRGGVILRERQTPRFQYVRRA